ncbi:unnamed protein product [Brassicogethes aeneus]|uniref:RING-type E3 ubiquitin transferase n=1 Tax=Brassicogethes aeneus TaxID=1431903 RepID=A0A9P0FEH4_BRAAE|nr:unnamed protein product [Brassicogethes aeneus]
MAEAAIEERPPLRFYCHVCNVQFQNASANFTCPHCSDGFIEELQENAEGTEDIVDEDWEDEDMDSIFASFVPDQRGRTRSSEGIRPGRRYANSTRARIVRPRTLTRLASSNLRQNNVPFEHLLQDFIINLGVGVNIGNNMQLFLGNPGDYAWGREGLDAIVTQLLNQMDSTGPPPVSKETIDALTVVEVTEEQVQSKLQCSVCWEDFRLREKVRQLPCLHIYHEPCIRPWLELHGTCPICRQNLVNADQPNNDGNEDSGNSGENLWNIRQLYRPATHLNTLFSSSSSSSSDTTSSSGGSSGSTRTRSPSDSSMM